MLSLYPKVGGVKEKKEKEKEEEENKFPSEGPHYCKGMWIKKKLMDLVQPQPPLGCELFFFTVPILAYIMKGGET